MARIERVQDSYASVWGASKRAVRYNVALRQGGEYTGGSLLDNERRVQNYHVLWLLGGYSALPSHFKEEEVRDVSRDDTEIVDFFVKVLVDVGRTSIYNSTPSLARRGEVSTSLLYTTIL